MAVIHPSKFLNVLRGYEMKIAERDKPPPSKNIKVSTSTQTSAMDTRTSPRKDDVKDPKEKKLVEDLVRKLDKASLIEHWLRETVTEVNNAIHFCIGTEVNL